MAKLSSYLRGSTTTTGISTSSNLVIGSDTSTGTADQNLQVSGGSYISGNTGIGSAIPQAKLDVLGDSIVSGISTASEFSLSALDSSISDTAVDVFVYDTRKDSDGGAWRKRTQHTSWYNETLNTATRGSRREFPAVAVIVLGSDFITIYDGDDPDMPMWMKFISNTTAGNSGGSHFVWSPCTLSSIVCKNGLMGWSDNGSAAGWYEANFISEKVIRRESGSLFARWAGNFSQRNGGSTFLTASSLDVGGIVNWYANDSAMTVLPNAPIDDATGLPVPTIAVGTDGGVSVIKDDGSVVDITITTGANNDADRVDFTDDNRVVVQWGGDAAGEITIDEIPSSDISQNYPINLPGSHYNDNSPESYSPIFLTEGPSQSNRHPTAIQQFRAVGTTAALSLFDENKTSEEDGMVAYATTSYNTGWMQGRIKGAFLSDTDATNITDANLITNGTFDTDLSGWSDPGSIASVSSGQVTLTSASGNPRIYQAFTVVPGKSYYFSLGTASGNASFYVSTNTVSSGSLTNVNGSVFTVPSGTTTVNVVLYVIGTGNTATYDNIVVKLADPDRSVNNQATNNGGKGLGVFGTINKSAVATGAELVAYSGFSASNYLEQPYNSDLNYGTGDFYFGGWFKNAGYSDSLIGRLHDSSSAGKGFLLSVSSSGGGGTLVFAIYTLGFQSSGRTTIGTTTDETGKGWQQVWAIRRGGTMELWLNGNLVTTGSNSADISDTTYNPPLFIGVQHGSSVFDGELALMRTGASAPSAEQIKKIYEDEKVLFQENANATLYGSSDAVTALAYDEDLQLLHVGTSSGRSDFQGLRRINNTTTAVTTAISASNGLVAEQ